LPICYEIVVEEHGGEITFDSIKDGFTSFKVVLPKNNNA
jgi:signal transduction histidine kinase